MAKQDCAPLELGDLYIEMRLALAMIDGARALSAEERDRNNVTRLLDRAHEEFSELIDAFGSALEREPRHV